MHTDTIAAVATSLSESALGIIRMSGPGSYDILNKIFQSSSHIEIRKALSHTVHHGYIIDSTNGSAPVDEVMVTLMRAPHSYTREDCVEISCHGSPVLLQKILEILLKKGAKLAEPGEFTKRAFLNGRIDIIQAESVADLIASRTLDASKNAFLQLKGALSKKMRELQDSIKEALIPLEAEIDFPDEEIEKRDTKKLYNRLQDTAKKTDMIISTYGDGKVLQEGLVIAITGRTNAGKSSLFNILIESPNRALVTSVAGTTRDAIEGNVTLNGRYLRIFDTAGLRKPKGVVEKKCQNAVQKFIGNSDCNIVLIDGSKPFGSKEIDIINKACNTPSPLRRGHPFYKKGNNTPPLRGHPFWEKGNNTPSCPASAGQGTPFTKRGIIPRPFGDTPFGKRGIPFLIVINKTDLPQKINIRKIEKMFPERNLLMISCKKKTGIENLRHAISEITKGERAGSGYPPAAGRAPTDIIITNLRHKNILENTNKCVKQAMRAIKNNCEAEFIASDLRRALENLQEITGEIVTDKILDDVFSRFCIGK